eukprot:XP_001697000.1 predicted protein [Chlamydomonas reinhardtii]
MAELDKIHAVFNDESVEGILDLVAGMGDLNDACTSIRETLLEYGQLCTPLQRFSRRIFDEEGITGQQAFPSPSDCLSAL